MKILLAHNSLYFPSHGGGDKSNRLLMEALAARGHVVEVFARLEQFGDAEEGKFAAELSERGTEIQSRTRGSIGFERNGVRVVTVTSDPRLRIAFAQAIERFEPDVILCSTDDPGALLLEVALRFPAPRVAYLVRATVAVPFGPDCSSANAAKTEMLGRADSIIGVSEYVAQYVREWSGFRAIHVPISLLEPGEYPALGRFENEFVLMVNPCGVKGLSIFVGLAEAMPEVQFAAIPTWGTNPDDLALLRRYSNIRLLAPVDDMADILGKTRVVLVPSVWAEARSRMVVEAMIRGIPVMASDVGGLHEAKLGVEYLIPVNPIQRYHGRVDANMVPVAEIPPQDVEPWRVALQTLVSDREHYEDLSRRSRVRALEYAEKLHAGWLERHLEELIRTPKRAAPLRGPARGGAIEQLSPSKRKLLALRIQNKVKAGGEGDLFPNAARLKEAPRLLFCFPWAGGGTTGFRGWAERVDAEAGICPVRLPGRESRSSEKPFEEMEALVEALVEAIRPYLKRDFAFLGHSMGAGIAFELTRALRRNGLPLPSRLTVSSARAPQLRSTPVARPEPLDEELMEQLRKLGGLPDEPELVRLALPALRADTRLYRRYVYRAEAPLGIPIDVYGGSEDESLKLEHLEAWREQTTGPFTLTLLPGGHFFFGSSHTLH